ncbi:transcription factor 21-like, partial [Babylonia areolata]|uniref:transcription factor 21-like n=1 Tax=Babylonia areolata TaxID=304850 RepID=UPI003FD14D44
MRGRAPLRDMLIQCDGPLPLSACPPVRCRRHGCCEEENDDDDDSKLQKPLQRSAANARERSRMRVLSKAFSKLKTTLPWVPPDTKLSKLDTLRLASSYIAHLRQILNVEEEEEEAAAA